MSVGRWWRGSSGNGGESVFVGTAFTVAPLSRVSPFLPPGLLPAVGGGSGSEEGKWRAAEPSAMAEEERGLPPPLPASACRAGTPAVPAPGRPSRAHRCAQSYGGNITGTGMWG